MSESEPNTSTESICVAAVVIFIFGGIFHALRSCDRRQSIDLCLKDKEHTVTECSKL